MESAQLSRPRVRVCYVRFTCAPCKGGAFQWVQVPPGQTLQPEATGAVMEVTKWLKPRCSGCRWTFWREILDCVFSMAWRDA